MSNSPNPICYGDIVYIQYDNLVLMANGQYSPTLHLNSTENIALKSFRNGLFTLYPQLNYQERTHIKQLEQKLESLKEQNSEESSAAQVQLEEEIKREKIILKENQAKLDVLNEKTFEEAKGKPIRYHEKLQLFHVESRIFVGISENIDKEEKSPLDFELSKEGNENFSFEFIDNGQGREIVDYETPVSLISSKHQTGLKLGVEIDKTSIKTELNPESNTLCSSDEEFTVIQRRRTEPIYQTEKVFTVEMCKIPNAEQNIQVKKFISHQDQVKAESKKCLKNGDYIRITNNKFCLYAIPKRTNIPFFFQAYSVSQDYKFNNVCTLFQILQVTPAKTANEGESFNPNNLPEGHLLEYNENNRYVLKHFATGKFLVFQGGNLQCLPIEDPANFQAISLTIQPEAGQTPHYIGKSSALQIKCYDNTGKEEGIFQLSEAITIPNIQLEINTLYYYGFVNPDNYLNKTLRPQRFTAAISQEASLVKSSLKFLGVTDGEICSIQIAEGFANEAQRFMDFLHEFKTGKKPENLKEFNEKIGKLAWICKQYAEEMSERGENEAIEDLLIPNHLRQTLLRELRVSNLLYMTLKYLIEDEDFRKRADRILKRIPEEVKAQVTEENAVKDEAAVQAENENLAEQRIEEKAEENSEEKIESDKKEETIENDETKEKTVISEEKDVEEKSQVPEEKKVDEISIENKANTEGQEKLESEEIIEVDHIAFELLIRTITKILLNSFKRNDLNRLYCSQFVRVPINCLTKDKGGIAGYLPEKERMLIKGYMLELAKQGLWDKDLDALGQLNFYESPIFEAIEDQETFHSYYIQIMTHISRSQAPNLQNLIRDNFVFTFLTKAENMMHLFPRLYEEENGKISLEFTRKKFPEINKKVCLNDLVPASSQIKALLEYFKESLRLIIALNNIDSTVFKLKIMRYYTYQDLSKAVDVLENSSQFRELRTLMSDTLTAIHQNYLSSPFKELPKQLQILNHQEKINEINAFISDSIKKGITEAEKDYLKGENAEDIIDTITLLTNQGDQTSDSLEILQQSPDINNLENCSIILEELKKFLISHNEIQFDFLKRSHHAVVSLINQALLKEGKIYTDFLSQALEVFHKIQARTVTHAANEIASELKDQYPTLKDSNIVTSLIKKWKASQGFLSETSNMLLDLFLLNQPHLQSEAIHQLRKLSSFESNLYRELDKLTILQDSESLEKTQEIVKITFRLNEIAREVLFCSDSSIQIEQEKLNTLLNEILECQWKLFFTIYDTSKHFRYPDNSCESPEKRFREAFETSKKARWDKVLALVPSAINTSFQKIFNILKTHLALFKTQHWVLNKKSGFDEAFTVHNYIIRLNLLLFQTFLKNNKENQLLFSESRSFIRQFYNQHFINQSPDSMLLFSEIFANNKKLLKLPKKYLYDITMSTYVGTFSRSITNTETNGYLAAVLMTYEFLGKVHVPKELFNAMTELKTKFSQIAVCENFTSLNVLESKEDVFASPFCYYSIRGTLNAFLQSFDYFAAELKTFGDLQETLSFDQWVNFFHSKNYLLQYELKNLAAKCFIKNYFSKISIKKSLIIQNPHETLKLTSCLLAEILFFRTHMAKKKGQNSSELSRLIESPSEIINDESFIKINEMQKEASEINFETKRIESFLENIPLENLFIDYIHEGCLELLLNLTSRYIEASNDDSESILTFTLDVLSEFIEFEGNSDKFPLKKVQEFFSEISSLESSAKYQPALVKITDKLNAQGQGQVKEEKCPTRDSHEIYKSLILPLYNSKKESKEQNIRQIAQNIAEHTKANDIISEILTYLKRNVDKLDHEEILFILRLLRKYIEVQNSNNVNKESIDKWEKIDDFDLKKIQETQDLYRNLGLSSLLSHLFSINDEKINQESLLLSLAFMYGGNIESQREFYESLKNESGNRVIKEIRQKIEGYWASLESSEQKSGAAQKNLFEYFLGKK